VLGLLAVLGIATRHCVALVRHYQDLRRDPAEGDRADGLRALVLRGTQDRLGPIVTTTLATAAVFLPLLFLGDVAGLEVVAPMAVVVLGGLITSAFLNLILVPALYLSAGSPDPEREVLAD
jgi:Cu/Ag efflux pump CusA